MLNDLIVAHTSDSAEEIDVYEAMAVRDDLRQIQNKSSDEYDLPAVGDIVNDPKSPNKFGCGDVRITEVYPSTEAKNWTIEDDDRHMSVADYNPYCDENAPVVGGVYVDGTSKVYHFPVDRLEWCDK